MTSYSVEWKLKGASDWLLACAHFDSFDSALRYARNSFRVDSQYEKVEYRIIKVTEEVLWTIN